MMREAITSSSPLRDAAQKTSKLRLLMDASYYRPWVGNLHIGKGKPAEERLNKDTNTQREVFMEREVVNSRQGLGRALSTIR